MATASMDRRISALSCPTADRSSGLRADNRSSDSSIDGTAAKIRPKASVVTQKPAGTLTASILESSPKFAPLPPTIAACDWSMSWRSSTKLIRAPFLQTRRPTMGG